ncbi:MAG: thiol reductant ABC exporter subunit CydD [Actinomycetes bacterium]
MRPLDPRLMRYARSTRAYLMATITLGVATALLVITQAWLLATAVNDVFRRGQSLSDVTPLLVGLGVVAVTRSVVAWGQESAANRSSAAVKQQLRSRLLAHVVDLGPGWLRGQRSGEITVLATRGLDGLDGYFSRYLPQLVLACIVPVAIVLVVLGQDWLSALIIVVTLPLIPVFMVLIGWTTQRQQNKQWRTLELLSGHFLDVVAGLPTLKVFGRAKAQAQSIRAVSDEYRRTTMTVLRISFVSSLVLELLASISVALVAVEIGVRLVEGTLTFFVGLYVLVLAPEAYLPLRLVGQHFHASQEGLTAAGRVFEVLETVPGAQGDRLAPDLRRTTVRFSEVAVRYPDRDEPAVDEATFEVAPGEVVALVGPSGCGKSTLVDVVLQFVGATSGTVWLDGGTSSVTLDDGTSSVVDLRDVDPQSWRAQVAWLPQRPVFVAGSVADNVRVVSPCATDDEVLEALRSAGAGFVDDLDSGIDTVLGDAGSGLSAGQRQRIALARVFVRQAPFVVLDEPTAGLDGETEQTVIDAVRRLAQGRTVLLVAHRPALVELADRVVTVGVASPPVTSAAAVGGTDV